MTANFDVRWWSMLKFVVVVTAQKTMDFGRIYLWTFYRPKYQSRIYCTVCSTLFSWLWLMTCIRDRDARTAPDWCTCTGTGRSNTTWPPPRTACPMCALEFYSEKFFKKILYRYRFFRAFFSLRHGKGGEGCMNPNPHRSKMWKIQFSLSLNWGVGEIYETKSASI